MNVKFRILNTNLHVFLSHRTELEYHIANVGFPEIIAITESFLDESVLEGHLEGFVIVSCLDRRDGRIQGGIAVFAHTSVEDMIVHIADAVAPRLIGVGRGTARLGACGHGYLREVVSVLATELPTDNILPLISCALKLGICSMP